MIKFYNKHKLFTLMIDMKLRLRTIVDIFERSLRLKYVCHHKILL